jgi:hypothetical protein
MKMKLAVVATLISLAFVSQAAPAASSGPDTVACDWTAAMAFVMRAVPCVSAALSHRSPRARDAASIEAHEARSDFVERKPFGVTSFILDIG